jgi:pimeloyl-ACP methyl ester carboxylesterase
VTIPETRYARAGEANVAYQVVGEGPDLLYVPGFVSHAEWSWEFPPFARFLRRLASFSRLILLDKRGTGLSDPVAGIPTPEERGDDILAVLGATGSERATLFGTFDGGSLSVLFAARHPERVQGLALYATPAKFTQSSDYAHGWSPAAIQFYLSASEDGWGSDAGAEVLAPSLAHDESYRRWYARLVRMAASPGMAVSLLQMNAQLDVRGALGEVGVPAVVLHRSGDALVDPGHSRYLAAHLPAARLVELDGADHWPWAGDADAVVAELQELVTGARGMPEPDRVLATLLFTDIVGSTELAARLGDRRWAELLEDHRALVRRELARFGGCELDTAGDGFFASFDGPTRAIGCAAAAGEAVRELGLELRAGVHTGECERVGEGLGGVHVHIGARVAAEAGPGEVVVSEVVCRLLDGSAITLEDRGVVDLTGVPTPQRLYVARQAHAAAPVTIP